MQRSRLEENTRDESHLGRAAGILTRHTVIGSSGAVRLGAVSPKQGIR
jgi:hypothetical protein